VLMISVHEAKRWPFSGDAADDAGGNACNLPVPAGFNDSEMRFLLHEVILPRIAAFRPEAIMLQCGADGLAEDPQAKLLLSNNAHREVVESLIGLAPRLLVLGGGGYHPYAVARCWALVWATLNGFPVPEPLPEAAQAVLRGLSYRGLNGRSPPEHWLSRLADAPREGPVRPEVRALAEYILEERPV
jgi:acetoin utilization protein AcuC